jgi:hypothetical protein
MFTIISPEQHFPILQQSLFERANIQSNKRVIRSCGTTQVHLFKYDRAEALQNRFTHADDAATSTDMITLYVAQRKNCQVIDIDHQGAAHNCARVHDIGHAPFGHEGARIINERFTALGVPEGFCDNNNNLTVITKNEIELSTHTLVSVIKYPERLYPSQKVHYQALLAQEIAKDKAHFEKMDIHLENQTRTIACQIMDEADRNSYICSDLADFLCLGNSLSIDALKAHAKKVGLVYRFTELTTLFAILRSGNKNAIKAHFNSLKSRFNANYTLTSAGLTVCDKDLLAYREFLWDIELTYYIKPLNAHREHQVKMTALNTYIDRVVNEGYAPSKHYKKAISAAPSEVERLRLMRDMIAETTDWFILNEGRVSAADAG